MVIRVQMALFFKANILSELLGNIKFKKNPLGFISSCCIFSPDLKEDD